MRPAGIYLISFPNLRWLTGAARTYYVAKDKPLPFNGVVSGRDQQMKNSAGSREGGAQGARSVPPGRRALPAPQKPLTQGSAQPVLVVDRVRLGVRAAFKTRFYRKVGTYKEVLYDDAEDTIKNLIGDITLEMSAEDYNPLPDLIVNNIEVEMEGEVRAKYGQLERSSSRSSTVAPRSRCSTKAR